jgi:hypothetical protein
MRRPLSLALGLCLGGCASAHLVTGVTPRGARYIPPADTLFSEVWQRQVLSYVRGRDTLRLPRQTFLVRTQEWNGYHITQQDVCVGVARCQRTDTFTVSPRGQYSGRGLLVLPDGRDLAPGVQWADSGTIDSGGVTGELHRTYHVERVIESDGRSLAEVIGDGSMHVHGTFQIETARTAWLDVRGSVHETHWFDVRAGRLVSNVASARLAGWGAMPNAAGGMDTMPAAMTFDVKGRSLTSERARLLARALPGRDSSVTTSADGELFLHTVQRDGDEIDAGLARPDGWVRTASERFAGGRPLTYDAVWSDTSLRGSTARHLERRGDSLLVRRDGRDTIIAVPSVPWAVGDAMNQELLVPVLLTLPRDKASHPVAIYRPYDGRWTVWQATVLETEGVYLIRLAVMPNDPEEILLVVTTSGDLLFAEQPRGAEPWMRMPPRGSVRRAVLEGLLERLTPKGRSAA